MRKARLTEHQLIAALSLECRALKDVIKKSFKPVIKRELVSYLTAQWSEEQGGMLDFIKPGKPTRNAFIERFNRTYWTENLGFTCSER